MFDNFGAEELFFTIGMALVVCLCIACIAVSLRRPGRRVFYTDAPSVAVTYEGALRHIPYIDLMDVPAEHFFKRVNNLLQLNSTYHDLRISKDWDTPNYLFLAPHAILRDFLTPETLARAKQVPLLVLREKFNVAGAFPWLYPVGHDACFGAKTEEVVTSDAGVTQRTTTEVVARSRTTLCFGMREGARVKRVPPHAGAGTVLRCDIKGQRVLVLWDEYLEGATAAGMAVDTEALGVWEFWGYNGEYTILPLAAPEHVQPLSSQRAIFRSVAGEARLVVPGAPPGARPQTIIQVDPPAPSEFTAPTSAEGDGYADTAHAFYRNAHSPPQQQEDGGTAAAEGLQNAAEVGLSSTSEPSEGMVGRPGVGGETAAPFPSGELG